MTTEHVSEALQQYFSRFGYVNSDKEYYKVDKISLRNGLVLVKGEVLDNG